MDCGGRGGALTAQGGARCLADTDYHYKLLRLQVKGPQLAAAPPRAALAGLVWVRCGGAAARAARPSAARPRRPPCLYFALKAMKAERDLRDCDVPLKAGPRPAGALA